MTKQQQRIFLLEITKNQNYSYPERFYDPKWRDMNDTNSSWHAHFYFAPKYGAQEGTLSNERTNATVRI